MTTTDYLESLQDDLDRTVTALELEEGTNFTNIADMAENGDIGKGSGSSDNTFTYYANDEGVAGSTTNSGLNITTNVETIPDYAFYNTYYGNAYYVKQVIKSVTLGNKVKNVGTRAFYMETFDITIPSINSIETIGERCFYQCTSLQEEIFLPNIKTFGIDAFKGESSGGRTSVKKVHLGTNITYLPNSCFASSSLEEINVDNITTLGNNVFNRTNVKKFSFKNLSGATQTGTFANNISLIQFSSNTGNIGGSYVNTNAVFYNDTSLKAVWLGSATKYMPFAGTFYMCSGLKYIYINETRAIVETNSYYSTLWSNNTVASDCVVICNDDDGFITQEEFDAIDWENYPTELEAE